MRIGLVGCGNWGRHILRDLRGLGCEVEVVARSEATRERASSGGAAAIVDGVEQLGDVSGVVVATPTDTHEQAVRAALGRAVPVFVEKPLAASADAARRLLDEGDGRLFVMDKWRYHPGVEALGQIARSGELGPVTGLILLRLGWGNPHPDVDPVWILAPHDLSIALEVLGSLPEPRFAAAELVAGAVTGMTAELGRSPSVWMHCSAASPVKRREVRLVCEGGVAALMDGWADELLVSRDPLGGAEPERRKVGDELPLRRELAAFLAHVRGGPPPRSSAREGAAIVETLAELRSLAGI